MGNGQLIYTPLLFQALTFDEAHYLSLDNSAFNMGTGDFSLDAYLKISSTPADTESWITAKGTSALTSAAGWHFFYEKTLLRLGLRINDGGATPLVVYSNNSAFSLDTDFWARVTVDRDGLATFFVNGVAMGTGAVSSKAGSLDNAENLKVGGYDASTKRHKGTISFLRIDKARILSADWCTQEWDRIRFGWPQRIGKATALWDFENSLIDLSAELFTLIYNGGGSPSYVDGPPFTSAPITISFTQNFSYGREENMVEGTDFARTLDGTGQSYALFTKMVHRLQFTGVLYSQWAAFMAAKMSGEPVDLYLDTGEEIVCTGLIKEIADSKIMAAFNAGEPTRNIALTIEET